VPGPFESLRANGGRRRGPGTLREPACGGRASRMNPSRASGRTGLNPTNYPSPRIRCIHRTPRRASQQSHRPGRGPASTPPTRHPPGGDTDHGTPWCVHTCTSDPGQHWDGLSKPPAPKRREHECAVLVVSKASSSSRWIGRARRPNCCARGELTAAKRGGCGRAPAALVAGGRGYERITSRLQSANLS
jgi:hypothetical protein